MKRDVINEVICLHVLSVVLKMFKNKKKQKVQDIVHDLQGMRIPIMRKKIISDVNGDNTIIQKVECKGISRYKSLKRRCLVSLEKQFPQRPKMLQVARDWNFASNGYMPM